MNVLDFIQWYFLVGVFMALAFTEAIKDGPDTEIMVAAFLFWPLFIGYWGAMVFAKFIKWTLK